MRQAQRKMSERKARRKRMALAVILLGHRVKSPVTVIFLDGALSVSILFVNRYICSSGSRPAHKSRFFYVIGNIVPYNVKLSEGSHCGGMDACRGCIFCREALGGKQAATEMRAVTPPYSMHIMELGGMAMSIFKGAGVAIVTPMKENEDVDYEKLEELIDWQIAQGTDCIVITGTTGESSTLTTEEHTKVIEAAVRFTGHRVPVVAGTGSNCTREAIHLSQEAERVGADGLLAVTPYYNKATQGGLIRYYTELAESVKLPIIMYNVPGRTGCNILPETAAELFHHVENIIGIKEATGNVAQAVRTMYLTDGKLDLYSGEDGIVVPLMAIGAVGVISVWSNIAPKDVHEMCAAFAAGDVARAMQMQLAAQPLIDALFCEVNPIPVKKALNLMGKKVGALRSPLTEMTEENAAKLAQAMRDYGIKLA